MKLALRLAFIVLACVVLTSFTTKEEAHPPHVEPRTGVLVGTPEYPDYLTAAADAAWVVEKEERERLEREQVEAALADLARQRAVRGSVGSTPSGDCAALAELWGLPEAVIQRESGCSTDAFNPAGCGGRGCIGLAQIDLGHFAAVSPWNPNVPGTCYGLDPGSIADQIECAGRLPASAWR